MCATWWPREIRNAINPARASPLVSLCAEVVESESIKEDPVGEEERDGAHLEPALVTKNIFVVGGDGDRVFSINAELPEEEKGRSPEAIVVKVLSRLTIGAVPRNKKAEKLFWSLNGNLNKISELENDRRDHSASFLNVGEAKMDSVEGSLKALVGVKLNYSRIQRVCRLLWRANGLTVGTVVAVMNMRNFGLGTPLPSLALVATTLIGVLAAVFIFQCATGE
ncbi:hypothetical protein KSP40_PGU013017 [Platanthera guangdongensis]|uniref:Uncharacterized protein n=1 Tax=Platanthera guangdongensis TaxID=2320717 RepID=A0ABR2MMC3_9ASPA